MNQKRINKVLEKMEERGIDYLLVTDPVSIDYLLDYVNHPGERMYVMVLSSKGNHQLFFNNLFYVGEDLGMPITWFDDTDNGPALLADYLKDAKVIGVDKNMPARFLIPVQDRVNAKYVLGSLCVDEVRMQKDDEEKALMFKASEMNDTAMAEVKRLLATDKTEIEMDEALLAYYKSLGASGHSFSPIMGYGANGANPHHSCDDSRLKPGDSIIVDMGCIYKGYCSDMTRTIMIGKADKKQKEIYNTVLNAQMTGLNVLKAGIGGFSADKAARDVIDEAGYGDYFGHSLGHGVGLQIHELPNLSPKSDIILEENMIVSCEPGIYIYGYGGVRIEDLVCVKNDGIRNLTNLSKELIEI